jgi:putative ABC transport system permease protein
MTLATRLLGRTPLGWLQLKHHPMRFAMAIAGVAFAVILVFMQLGFMNMLFDTTVMIHKLIKADIVIVNPDARGDLANVKNFPRRRLVQALGVEGVADVEALYVGNISWLKPVTGDKGTAFALAVRPDFSAFKDPALATQLPVLSEPGTVLFDTGSRGDYAAFGEQIVAGARPTTEAGGRTITFAGTFRIGASFGIEAMIVTSDQTFLALNPNINQGTVNIGLIQLQKGADAEVVAARLREVITAEDAEVLTMQQFINKTRDLLRKESPIAYIFSFGVFMGLVVGIIIVVQILTTDVQDHLPEYATFKAIGFSNGRLLSIVYEQAAILTIFGFIPGLIVSLGAYELVKAGVSMPITMPLDRVASVFGLTAGMCILAGTVAIRRVSKADPAEVF